MDVLFLFFQQNFNQMNSFKEMIISFLNKIIAF